jgi:hypothetical protein
LRDRDVELSAARLGLYRRRADLLERGQVILDLARRNIDITALI